MPPGHCIHACASTCALYVRSRIFSLKFSANLPENQHCRRWKTAPPPEYAPTTGVCYFHYKLIIFSQKTDLVISCEKTLFPIKMLIK
ncbi:unnamed protein product, partial [Cuscuta epithymum]